MKNGKEIEFQIEFCFQTLISFYTKSKAQKDATASQKLSVNTWWITQKGSEHKKSV